MSTNAHHTVVPGAPDTDPAPMDRSMLRLAGWLLLAGQLLYILVTQFHAGGDANDHREIFLHYAGSGDWKGVHVGQFAAMAVIVAGLLTLGNARSAHAAAAAKTASRAAIGAVSKAASALAGVALALYAVLQAVDGIGNQQVDSAWAHAAGSEKAARFASAEAMRWLEWGMRSYHDYSLGVALLLLAVTAGVLYRGTVPKGVTWLMAATGVVYLAQGWVVGQDGFSAANSVLIVAAWALSLVWMAWLTIAARSVVTDGDRPRRRGPLAASEDVRR